MFMINIVKMFIYRSNAISMKITANFFFFGTNLWADSKFYMAMQRTQNSKNNFEKQTKEVENLYSLFQDLLQRHNKISVVLAKERSIDQKNRLESRK